MTALGISCRLVASIGKAQAFANTLVTVPKPLGCWAARRKKTCRSTCRRIRPSRTLAAYKRLWQTSQSEMPLQQRGLPLPGNSQRCGGNKVVPSPGGVQGLYSLPMPRLEQPPSIETTITVSQPARARSCISWRLFHSRFLFRCLLTSCWQNNVHQLEPTRNLSAAPPPPPLPRWPVFEQIDRAVPEPTWHR